MPLFNLSSYFTLFHKSVICVFFSVSAMLVFVLISRTVAMGFIILCKFRVYMHVDLWLIVAS